jgi:hypothetical protein
MQKKTGIRIDDAQNKKNLQDLKKLREMRKDADKEFKRERKGTE